MLPNGILTGKPFKILHSDPDSREIPDLHRLETCASGRTLKRNEQSCLRHPVHSFSNVFKIIHYVIYSSTASYVSAIRLSSPTISSGSIGLRTFLYSAIVRSWEQFPGVRAMIYSFSTS